MEQHLRNLRKEWKNLIERCGCSSAGISITKKEAEEAKKKEAKKNNQFLKPSTEEQRRREKEAYERLRAQAELDYFRRGY